MLSYPKAKKESATDTYYGVCVPDPYQWLEHDHSADTKEWIVSENKLSAAYFDQISFRRAMQERLEMLWDYEKFSAPCKEGQFTYFYKNNGLQSHSILYRQQSKEVPEIFIDPNVLSVDGTTLLAGITFNQDSSLVAYQLSEGGSDWQKIRVMRAADKAVLSDTLVNVKFSQIAWKGSEGFYYSSYDSPRSGSQLSGATPHHKLYYHKLGTPQSDDQLVFGGPTRPRLYTVAYVTEDGRFLVVLAANSLSGNELYVQDLHEEHSPFIKLVDNFDSQHVVLYNVSTKLYVYTNKNAPNFKIVTVDVANPVVPVWQELVPETKHVLNATTGGGKLFARYLEDVTSVVEQYSLDGIYERRIPLPSVGTAYGFSAKTGESDIYFTFTSYLIPPTIYKYNLQTGATEVFKKPDLEFDADAYESKQVFYNSKDGTRIPMVITYKKGIVLNGKNPTLLRGYGGFGASMTPEFSVSNIVLLEQGGIYAVPNLRGGGEYGRKWHTAGIQLNKQNVFDDFIAAAEYLIENQYTSSKCLAIAGSSNGGLLVGAVLTQRPDLCQVAFPAVGVMDMLRYPKFTTGAGWAYEYGTVHDSEEMFKYLLGYSPYHALKPSCYPATLITTADHDDRVVPAHSYKFAARLQEYQQAPAPVLIYIRNKAGHGGGKPTAQFIDEEVDKLAFFFYNITQQAE